jgi:hypothetical protein
MLTEGQTIGNYRVVRKLGEGGMGAVFEAVHQEIGRRAAIKVLHPQFAASPQVATRFLNEAKAANLIEHPGVVEIFEFGRLQDGTTFIVMEYLKGDSLAKRIERGSMGAETLRIGRQIASVLAAAHEKGIVHRDLKPDEVAPPVAVGGRGGRADAERTGMGGGCARLRSAVGGTRRCLRVSQGGQAARTSARAAAGTSGLSAKLCKIWQPSR